MDHNDIKTMFYLFAYRTTVRSSLVISSINPKFFMLLAQDVISIVYVRDLGKVRTVNDPLARSFRGADTHCREVEIHSIISIP